MSTEKNDSIFKTSFFKTSIYLHPIQLDEKYMDHLLLEIRSKYENKCQKEIGYIHKIIQIHRILHEEIMNMIPNVIFYLESQILYYYPHIGDRIPIKVDLIFSQGIFGYFHKIKILVPITYCKNIWNIQQDFTECIAQSVSSPNISLKKSDECWVELRHIRFEKETFSCIAVPIL